MAVSVGKNMCTLSLMWMETTGKLTPTNTKFYALMRQSRQNRLSCARRSRASRKNMHGFCGKSMVAWWASKRTLKMERSDPSCTAELRIAISDNDDLRCCCRMMAPAFGRALLCFSTLCASLNCNSTLRNTCRLGRAQKQ